MPGKEGKGGSCLCGLMLPPIFPDFVGTLSLASGTYKDLEPFCQVSPVITGSHRDRGRTGPLVKSRLLLYPDMWPPALQVGEEHPGLCWPCFLWSYAGTCPQDPGFPSPSQGTMPGAESPRVAGRAGGGFWGSAAFLNALLPSWYRGHFLKVLVPSNILCREGGKIYSGNYFLTVW